MLVAACSSGSGGTGPSGPSGPVTSSPTSSRSPTDSPAPSTSEAELRPDGSFELSAGQVTIRPSPKGWLHVLGRYPFVPSRCIDADRPTLEARYPGDMTIRTDPDGNLTVVLTLEFERYLEGIAEVPPTWPSAALEAQAIAARSYVLARTGWTGKPGESLDSPICATADCQVYGGIPVPRPPRLQRWYAAVHNTSGQVLRYQGRPADTVYYSTSNGHTYGNDEVFGSAPLPYLQPVVERDDGASPLSHWRVELPLRDLTTILRGSGSWPRGARIASASVRGSSIQLAGDGQRRIVDASTLRDAANTWGPCLLPDRYPSGGLPLTIPSGWMRVSTSPGGLIVTGRGWGHGVGMVQWGAYGKARRGWSADRILGFYYGGLTPTRLREPATVRVVVAQGLRSMTVRPSGRGATVGTRTVDGPMRVVGGNGVTVSSG